MTPEAAKPFTIRRKAMPQIEVTVERQEGKYFIGALGQAYHTHFWERVT